MTDEHRIRMARDLRRASGHHQTPIWRRLSDEALKPSGARRTINVRDIAKLTKDGDTVAFPGKVLGTGDISHVVVLFSFGISETAMSKIVRAGGRVVDHRTMVSERPAGTGVVLLG